MVRDELGRRRLMQWDINQRLIVDVPAGTQIHYASEAIGDKALVTIAYEENGLIYSNIPNILLQSPGTITVYVYPIKDEEAHTKSCATIVVLPRAKPEDYVYTETEVLDWRTLDRKIGDLAKLTTTAKENLVAAINEAAQNGGMLLVDLEYNMTADKTYSEIQTAVLSGKAVIVRYTTYAGYDYYILTSFNGIDQAFYFNAFIGDTKNVLGCATGNRWSITSERFESKSSKVTALSASSSNEQYPSAKATYDAIQNASVVTVKITGSGTDSNPYASSMTFDEIQSAMQAGRTVVGIRPSSNPAFFIACISFSGLITFTRLAVLNIMNDDVICESFTIFKDGHITHKNSRLEETANKVTSVSADSTDRQYPSAKAVYDTIQATKPDIVTPSAASTDTQAASAKAVWDMLGDVKTLIDGM